MTNKEKYAPVYPSGMVVKKNKKLPFFIIADIEIYKEEFIKFLNSCPEEVVRFQMKDTEEGNPYCVLNTWFKPENYQKIMIYKKENEE